jgi:uncharacterized membrane protein
VSLVDFVFKSELSSDSEITLSLFLSALLNILIISSFSLLFFIFFIKRTNSPKSNVPFPSVSKLLLSLFIILVVVTIVEVDVVVVKAICVVVFCD